MTPASATPADPARLYALVPCAGVGERAGASGPKQYAPLGGRSLVAHTLAALAHVARLHATLVVLSPTDAQFERHAPHFAGWVSRRGGVSRAQTVANGLDELAARGAQVQDWVLVHDAARCLVRPEWIDALIDACLDDPVGGLLALPLADTLKAERDGRSMA
ncbi:MAG: 2-C-methyl-D-erythritol 4-phosphate cytidylyltransferase, partial [Burkholderiales bacterium]|nr:2-C-methyl-D-erythritol 4-phosphate cytidylyltransferase [Burkholderiales bacterium]